MWQCVADLRNDKTDMITRLTHTFIYVLNLDSAIDFYTKKLGFKIHADLVVNGDRWVTLHLPEQPGMEILLVVVVEGMIFKANQVKQMTQLISAQTLSYGVFECADVRAFYEEKKMLGVEFCIDPYHNPELDVFEAAFFDDSGNWFRVTEPR